MRVRSLIVGLAAVGMFFIVVGRTWAEDKPAMGDMSPEEMAKMMEDWKALNQPSKGHDQLKQFVGKWNTVTKMWWGGPGTPATETKGTAEIKSIFGGRFIVQETTSEMQMPTATGEMETVPYHGMGITGYDNYRNVYISTWMDDMDTAMYTSRGTADPSGKIFSYYGEMDEPGMKMTGRMVHYKTRIINADKHVFEMFDLAVAPDYKVMEITYTRQ